MKSAGRWVWLAAVGAAALSLGGCCTFAGSEGGGPLRYDELGDWLGIAPRHQHPPDRLAEIERELRGRKYEHFRDHYSLSAAGLTDTGSVGVGLDVEGRYNSWLQLIPSVRRGHWLFFKRYTQDNRRFYAYEEEFGAGWLFPVPLGEWLLFRRHKDVYDVDTGKRVAAVTSSIGGVGLLWMRGRSILPVDSLGMPGLRALLNPKIKIDEAAYQVKDATLLFGGAIGWGRVNRRRYLQLLWIPVPLGEVDTTGTEK